MTPTARSLGLDFGGAPTGPTNSLTDVAGVRVGHATLCDPARGLHTGFTAVLPQAGDLFRDKVPAAVEVINGFGKSAGLMQVRELGCIETPILLTNTFAVATGMQVLIRRAIAADPRIGRDTGTVNPLVLECNDGWLNNIQDLALTEADAEKAIADAESANGCATVRQGSIGAGSGMSCFGFKGGIGSASRALKLDDLDFMLGVLVLANFGRAGDLRLPDGRRPDPAGMAPTDAEKGSVIILLATDVPLECRQLMRVARRTGAGLARLGSFWGNGSGDIAVAFSTARRIAHDELRALIPVTILNESHIDALFRAAADATAEAVLNALCAATALTGRDGHWRPSLADWLTSQGWKGNNP
ncbi:P1 family peptidase [Telmatospirillum sp.]|uniref:DmpA family aminopeptidase n=1 Tax=Telmatospirillum sp. TaxID=2079197 RepID=UPI002842350B|nr:P1 family peptidase [Telmatospirillum sp.]MDR3436362.1 P1 family peptidase [Telmatospirillum sp.]